MNPRRLPLALFVFLFSVIAPVAATPATLSEAKTAATTAIDRPDLVAYRGWLKYLLFQADHAAAGRGTDNPIARETIARLTEWTQRITANPTLLSTLRGVQEWAYESPADGSGQPFKIMIPTDYDPTRPPGVSLIMHGISGDHLSQSTGMKSRAGNFEIAVLGRSRGGWYVGLSQADVLHVLAYVEAHWKIDPDQIHLAGGSMGGAGTYRLATRFPDRFASGQVTCGMLLQEPLGNLLTVPIYATHSDDDPVVSILLDRGSLTTLRQRGAQNIFDEATGFGHAVWNYTAGNQRSNTWVTHQKRPASREVLHVDFTALDGGATRGWWAEVTEWGPAPKPAHFILTAGNDNTLFAELTNINRLTLRLDESPFDPQRPLQISLDGQVPVIIPAPLPDSLTIRPTGAPVTDEARPAIRPHTPGGAIQLYNGEPLLIVYGTHGSEQSRAALYDAADAASKSSNPAWVADNGERDPGDQVPHHQNLFGRLNVKTDTDVTEADLARCHLVLIGTAAENSLVGRLANKLPVQFTASEIRCDDGFTLTSRDRMIGLIHVNPLAPTRLIFWVASADPNGYAAEALIPALSMEFFHGADLIITHATAKTLVASRSFDAHWQWTGNRAASPLIPARLASHDKLAQAIAESVRQATAANFAVSGLSIPLGTTAITSEITRVDDLIPFYYAQSIDVLEFTGADLLKVNARIAVTKLKPGQHVEIQPQIDAARINPVETYRIAVPINLLYSFGRSVLNTPVVQHRTDISLDDAIQRFFPRE